MISGAFIAAKGTITVSNTGKVAVSNNGNKETVFKNCAPFTDWICERSNRQIDK